MCSEVKFQSKKIITNFRYTYIIKSIKHSSSDRTSSTNEYFVNSKQSLNYSDDIQSAFRGQNGIV